MGDDFSSERERVGGDTPGGALHRAGAAFGRGLGATRGWDPPLPMVGPPGQPQPLLWLILKDKNHVIFLEFFDNFSRRTCKRLKMS